MAHSRVPVALPRLPNSGVLLPYLQEIDHNRIYSNYGPLNSRLRAALATHYDLPPECVTTVVNATAGLTLALMAANVPAGGYCLMPCWTFVATAHAALAAGLVPYFLDVNELTWALDVKRVAEVIHRLKGHVAAVIPVFPFGKPLHLPEWDALSAEFNIPIIIDAAAGFDSLVPGDVPAVVSLHATKVLGAGEGGFVVSQRPDAIEAIQLRANFGFHDRREALVPALNGKMNEYNAAVGLASLTQWSTIWEEFAASATYYCQHSTESSNFSLQPGFGASWLAASCTVRLHHVTASACMEKLREMCIDTRAWWSQGLHMQPAFRHLTRDDDLPVTKILSNFTIGLLFYRGIDRTLVGEISRMVAEISTAPP